MKRWGIYLIILGIGSFLLPMLGLQFKLLMLFGEAVPVIGGLLVVVGIFLIVGGTIAEKKHIQSVAGAAGGGTAAAPGLKCYACKADISETDTVCPKCKTPL